MRTAGTILMILGAVLVLVAFGMDTTVYSAGTMIAGSYVGGGSTHNLGLLQSQIMTLHVGVAAFIAGSVLVAAPVSGVDARGMIEPPSEAELDLDDARLRRNRIAVASGILIVLVVLAILAN